MKKRLVTTAFLVLGVLGAWMQLRGRPTDRLLGLWAVEDVGVPTDPMHFYYFHKGGHGLYRYGWVGYNQTNSFDWSVEGDKLVLRFRKTGERATTTFTIRGEGDHRWLALASDPRGETGLRYRFRPVRPSNLGEGLDENIVALELPDQAVSSEVNALEGRIWLDYKKYATGGSGFSMYQLANRVQKAGWRVGWHHVGDFDDWTTELLSYRVDGNALRLSFVFREGREGHSETPFEISRDRDRTVARLARDPRNFSAATRFVDGGPSF
jgi:hypothetical protein